MLITRTERDLSGFFELILKIFRHFFFLFFFLFCFFFFLPEMEHNKFYIHLVTVVPDSLFSEWAKLSNGLATNTACTGACREEEV